MARSIRDDHDLLAACAEGDEQALGSLYDRFGKVAYGLALRVLRDAALAEDAVQEAFLAVWRQAARFDRSRGTASTWILMLVHRRAVDLVRSQARFNALPDQLEVTAPPGRRRRERRRRRRASRGARRGSGSAGNAVEGRARSPRPRLLGRPDPVGDRDRARHPARDGEEPDVQRSGTSPGGAEPGARANGRLLGGRIVTARLGSWPALPFRSPRTDDSGGGRELKRSEADAEGWC